MDEIHKQLQPNERRNVYRRRAETRMLVSGSALMLDCCFFNSVSSPSSLCRPFLFSFLCPSPSLSLFPVCVSLSLQIGTQRLAHTPSYVKILPSFAFSPRPRTHLSCVVELDFPSFLHPFRNHHLHSFPYNRAVGLAALKIGPNLVAIPIFPLILI
jgi:hypothetical protein